MQRSGPLARLPEVENLTLILLATALAWLDLCLFAPCKIIYFTSLYYFVNEMKIYVMYFEKLTLNI